MRTALTAHHDLVDLLRAFSMNCAQSTGERTDDITTGRKANDGERGEDSRRAQEPRWVKPRAARTTPPAMRLPAGRAGQPNLERPARSAKVGRPRSGLRTRPGCRRGTRGQLPGPLQSKAFVARTSKRCRGPVNLLPLTARCSALRQRAGPEARARRASTGREANPGPLQLLSPRPPPTCARAGQM